MNLRQNSVNNYWHIKYLILFIEMVYLVLLFPYSFDRMVYVVFGMMCVHGIFYQEYLILSLSVCVIKRNPKMYNIWGLQ